MAPFCPCFIFTATITMLSWGVASPPPFVTYHELQQMNASCPDKDTCQGTYSDVDLLNNCQCGPSCARFGTCCLDAPHREAKMVDYGGGFQCEVPYGDTVGMFMVGKCPTDWEGDDNVRDLCVGDGEEKSDLMLLVPVSSMKTGVTYRNHFCFICNNIDDDDDSIISWDISIRFSDVPYARDVALSDIFFDKAYKQWTYPDARPMSIRRLNTVAPSELRETHPHLSIFCRQSVVSSCAQDWTEPETRSKCESYTALVSMSGDNYYMMNYRNVHCGLCNWARLHSLECREVIGRGQGGSSFVGDAAKVFEELFRISEVPEDPCRVGQIYDRTTKKCRNLWCGRKMKMVKGRCVKKE